MLSLYRVIMSWLLVIYISSFCYVNIVESLCLYLVSYEILFFFVCNPTIRVPSGLHSCILDLPRVWEIAGQIIGGYFTGNLKEISVHTLLYTGIT